MHLSNKTTRHQTRSLELLIRFSDYLAFTVEKINPEVDFCFMAN